MSDKATDAISLRNQRQADLELLLFRHGFDIVHNDTGATYVRVSTTHPSTVVEPLMLDYKRAIANHIQHALGTPHDVAMHFLHRYAVRTQSWANPSQP